MKQSDGPIPPESLANLSDRELWQRGSAIELAEHDTEHFLDLAGFADGQLDSDDQERVAEWLALDPAEAADVAAARVLGAVHDPGGVLPEAAFARAAALVGQDAVAADNVVPFAPGRRRAVSLPDLARWGSLAAAVVLASWLGFNMGMDVSRSLAQGARNSSDDGGLNELFDPTARLSRDLTDSPQA